MKHVNVGEAVNLGDMIPSPHVRCGAAVVDAIGEWDGRRAVYATCECGHPIEVIDGVEQMGLL